MSRVAVAVAPHSPGSVVRDYLQLSKARIVMMVLITTAAAFVVGVRGISAVALFNTLFGTAMVAAGTNALNQYVERDYDALMRRTRNRPLPDGRITPRNALVFSAGIAAAGTLYLGLTVNWLTAGLGVLTLASYIFVYTPLKRITSLCTVVGAIPGAIPPVMGWAAARGHIGIGGAIFFGLLFFWQLPHFMAISWIYREDYGRAGFAMTSVRDANGTSSARQAILWSIALIGVSVLPTFAGMAGVTYLVAATVSGVALLGMSIAFFFDRSNRMAMKLFMTSNVYLVVVMALLIVSARS